MYIKNKDFDILFRACVSAFVTRIFKNFASEPQRFSSEAKEAFCPYKNGMNIVYSCASISIYLAQVHPAAGRQMVWKTETRKW